jgi:quercetin dioxygenase-like cupin family protein
MIKLDLDQIEPREVAPGFNARFIHSKNMTFSYWTINSGARLPEHSHPHEQVVNMLEGRFEMTVGSETTELTPGMVVVIPGDIPHSGYALSDCRILDVFHPVREEYR